MPGRGLVLHADHHPAGLRCCLGMWVAFCFIEGRFVPISWEMVTLVAGSQGAKAAQLRFELGRGGLASYDPSEGEGLR